MSSVPFDWQRSMIFVLLASWPLRKSKPFVSNELSLPPFGCMCNTMTRTSWPSTSNVGITNTISSWSSSSSSRTTVRFSSPLITSIHKRTRTHILDVPKLYYSPSDIKQFKREYRQLVRAQELTRERMLENSLRTVEETKNGEDERMSKDDSCLDSSCTSQPVRDEKNKRCNDDISFQKMSKQTSSCEDGAWDPLNDGSSSVVTTSSSQDTPFSSNPSPPPATTGGIFSSVYDVASSLFNGTPSLYYSSSPSYESSSTTESSSTYSEQCSSQRRRPRRRLSNTSMHLVDTLYLF